VALQVDDEGSRHIVRLELNSRGSAITQVRRLELPAPTTGPAFMTISGDELVYLTAGSNEAGGQREFVAHRVPLR